MNLAESQAAEVELENLVDKVGVDNVLSCLSTVCMIKAGHLASEWQDLKAGSQWEAASKVIERLSGMAVVKNISFR
jgi:hypothetical protein